MSNLQVIEQKQVVFYEDEITAVLVESGDQQIVYVPIRQICDFLGLAFSAQRTRINRDPVLSEEFVIVTITNSRRGNPQQACLPLKFIPGWLFGISANRVKEQMRDKIIRYQRECYEVLWEAFQGGKLTEPNIDILLAQDTPEAQAYHMAAAILQMARNQLIIRGQLDDHEQRLQDIESQLGDSRTITKDQATAISQAVKAIAYELNKQTGRNEYAGVYGELYRRYRIPSYRELPANQYDDAISWLGEWLETLTGNEPF